VPCSCIRRRDAPAGGGNGGRSACGGDGELRGGPLWLTAGSAGRGMNGVSGAFVKTRDENSYFTPIAWVRPCNSLSECGFSCPEGRNGDRIVQKGDAPPRGRGGGGGGRGGGGAGGGGAAPCRAA